MKRQGYDGSPFSYICIGIFPDGNKEIIIINLFHYRIKLN